MAQEKNKKANTGQVKKVDTARSGGKVSASKTAQKAVQKAEKKPYNENSAINIAAPYLFAFLGIFIAVTFIFRDSMNIIGSAATVFFGLFAGAMWFVPPALLLIGVRWRKDAPRGLVHFRFICLAVCVIFGAAFIHLCAIPKEALVMDPKLLYESGASLSGGGIVGGWICYLLEKLCGGIGTGIITLSLTLLFAFLIFGITIADLWTLIVTKIRELSYDISNARQVRREEAENLRQSEIRRQRERQEQERAAFEAQQAANAATEEAVSPQVASLAATRNRAAEHPEFNFGSAAANGGEGVFSDGNGAVSTVEPMHAVKEPIIDYFEDDAVISGGGVTVPAGSVQADDDVNAEEDENEPPFEVDEHSGQEKKADSKSVFGDIFCDDAVIEGAGTSISAKDIGGASTRKRPEEFGVDDEIAGEINGEGLIGEDGRIIEFDADDDMAVPADGEQVEEEAVAEYVFPPIDLLPGNPNPSVFKVTDELTQRAKNLVDTLASFGVRAKVQNICCGPTVTRYELKPEVGVKVKSIQNLSDDIALHLRAKSVRIEAPIPGKDAVGIEIPNDNVSTVYIRELIDRDEFRNLPSKLSVALGMDVSGTPVYMDIAKMPHMLIAGATGMGKSVCINSIITSILYKATPDEVKLILIDPKKVEFAMYDRIPHLLVPVVTEPKRAAGSLAWAVNEMEYRFTQIEAAKCRDLKSYNAVCETDSRFTKLPQIVIIIDELADLMMTARDEVETSICRLAQKARAAGMHLIIGTQRPSVDVITGVIKSNIPSRVAFTVASQVDSRTIIDIAGAENLLGKGDMLFAPVGSMKPTRVQGSYVGADSVIEQITDFLRNSSVQAYDENIQNAIDEEARKCGEKKKGKGASSDSGSGGSFSGSSEGFDRDEMMLPALELGVDCGHISTSLLQRRLSLGYARAARIVDLLAEMGYVGPFEGSKPRKVLITREELIEMKANSNLDD